jgi:hypothetical protein
VLTRRLWAALLQPDETHPLFGRVRAQIVRWPAGTARLGRFHKPLSWLALPFNALLVVIAPAALPVAMNLLGGLVAFNIMTTIERERTQHTYDLLALTPAGRGQINWLIAVGCVYRLRLIEQITNLRTLAVLTTVLLIFYSFQGTILTPLALILGLIALNLDAIQTLILACLSGMLAQEFSTQGAPYAALAIFTFVQIMLVYLPVTIAVIVLAVALFERHLDQWLIETTAAGLGLVLSFGLREGIARLMWRELERRLL